MLLPLLTMTTEVTDTMEDTTYTHYRSQGTTSELIPSIKSLLPFILQVSLCFHRQPGDLAMLVCLVYKQAAMKNVNIFVCNQIVPDLLSRSSRQSRLI